MLALVTAVRIIVRSCSLLRLGSLPNLHQGVDLRGKGSRPRLAHDNTIAMKAGLVCHNCISSSGVTPFSVGIGISGIMTLRICSRIDAAASMAMDGTILVAS